MNTYARFIPLVFRQVIRNRTRTLLTVGGVTTAMFLFFAVQAMQEGVKAATRQTAEDTTLIVYRLNRYCPFTSRIPEHYGQRIARVPGVAGVVPMKIVPTNCRTSLDVITFRGVPGETFEANFAPRLNVLDGSIRDWSRRSDAALVGDVMAKRRGFKVGDQFSAGGIEVYVAGIIASDEPQDQNVAYVHLDFVQQATDKRLGMVTQFSVRVDDPTRLDAVARAIDAEFANDPDPTATSPEKAFVGRAAQDVVRIVSFTQWLGWGCLAAVLALVANAIVLSVQDRIREHAVLQTLGFTGRMIAALIVAEGLLLGVMGGILGTFAGMAVVHLGRFSISSEGLSIQITAGTSVVVAGLIVSALLGALAGLAPAWQASRREITACFRAV